MGEIDTKPIESVQTVITFFGQSNDQKKNSPIKDDQQQEVKKERELECAEKEVANLKVQLEAKDNAYKQALVMIDHHHKTAADLSILLNKSDIQKDFYINETRAAKTRANELDSALEQTLSESKRTLLNATNDLQSQLTVLREAKTESENLLKAELLRQVETMHDLENRVVEKSAEIESLRIELKQVNMLHISSEKVASNAIFEANKIREEMEGQEKTRLDQAEYINLLETELKQGRIELEKVKSEVEKSKEKENEAEIEIAMVKFELHKSRAKLAAAEAAETRAQSQKSALYNALQQMGMEAEEMNKENRMLKESMQVDDDEESEVLVGKDEEGDGGEVEKVRRELEIMMSKMGEMRTRVAQAMSRAEAAEKGKGVLEEQIRKRKEVKKRRRAALAALREESISTLDDNSIQRDTSSAKTYQPLGKVLNMKF
ncbi:hypothetical protein ACS0TY_034620 [Phlomoides rotata]